MTPCISFMPLCLSPEGQGASWRACLERDVSSWVWPGPVAGSRGAPAGLCSTGWWMAVLPWTAQRVGGKFLLCNAVTGLVHPRDGWHSKRSKRQGAMWLSKLTSSCVLFSQYTERCHTRPLHRGVTAPEEHKLGGGPHLAGKYIMGENAHMCTEAPLVDRSLFKTFFTF